MAMLHIFVYQVWYLFLGSWKEVSIEHLTGLQKRFFERKCWLITNSKSHGKIKVLNITVIKEEKVKLWECEKTIQWTSIVILVNSSKRRCKIYMLYNSIWQIREYCTTQTLNAFVISQFSDCILTWMLHIQVWNTEWTN